MARFRCTNEVVVPGIDRVEYRFPRVIHQSVNPLLGSDSTGFGCSLNFGSVLVNTRKEPHALSPLPVPAG